MRNLAIGSALLALALAACGSEATPNGADASVAQADVGAARDDAGEVGLDARSQSPADVGATSDAGARADASIAGEDAATCAPAFEPPLTGPAQAVIVTNVTLKPVFERLARIHSVTGIPTEVVTVEELCPAGSCVDADPKRDTVKAIKDHLRSRTGLKYAVLGGGIDVVPARKVHDSYSNPLMPSYSFEGDFVTDYYLSDLSEWDTNGDGVYADKGKDTPGYRPAIAVSRIPVHTLLEAQTYLDKVVRHLTAYDPASAQKALAVTNIATQYSGMNIDSAIYLEAGGRTLSLLPADFAVQKLYATSAVDPAAGAYTAQGVIDALTEGQNLVVHSGHGGNHEVTVEIDGSEAFTGTAAFGLTNATLPIFLSCGCEAGDYATAHNAGEQLVLAPGGGAIAYLGNAPIGLGIAGGMQIIDELLRYVQATDQPLLADAYLAGHQNLPTKDNFKIIVNVPVVNQDSYQWTQKAVVFFGDELIPVWKSGRPAAPTLSAKKIALCQGSALELTLGEPATGTLQVLVDGARYEVKLAHQSTATLNLSGSPTSAVVGFTSTATQHGFWELAL